MPCKRDVPTYKTKGSAQRHGHIQYGKGKFRVYKVKGPPRGWNVIKRKSR